MVTKTLVQLTDDLDPSLEATDTIRFAFGNTEYEIDLSDDHINELRSALDKYIQHARKVGGRRGSAASARQSSGRRPDHAQVRQWAASNGVELSTRGRIAGGVLAAYDAKDVRALRAATGTPEPLAKPTRRSRAKAASVTARAK
jgi:nucleoid-associated protein Lsr2